MDIVKMSGVAIVTAILYITIKQYKPEMALLVTLIGGCAMLLLTVKAVSPIFYTMFDIVRRTNLSYSQIKTLLQIAGIAIVAELASDVCKESGAVSLSSKVQLAAKVIILGVSLPLFLEILSIVEGYL